MAGSCRIYINKLSSDDGVRKQLESYHNSIFQELKDSKLFKPYKGLEFLPSTSDDGYSKAKSLISSTNEKWGTTVTDTAFTKPSGREYVFVNVRNLVEKAAQESASAVQENLFSQKEQFNYPKTLLEEMTMKGVFDKETMKAALPIRDAEEMVGYVESERQMELVKGILEYIVSHKDKYEGDAVGAIPGWFMNAVSVYRAHFMYEDLTDAMRVAIKDIASLEWESSKSGIKPNFQDLVEVELPPSERKPGESFPSMVPYNQIGEEAHVTVPSKASKATINKVKEFLKRVGVNWMTASQRSGIQASADILNNLIQVAEGKEDVALTEEAMHFAVEIMEQTNPALFNQMLSQIGSYQIYKDVLNLYRNERAYQTPDGKPNIRKIKKEAIGKALAETVVRLNDGSIEKPEFLAQTKTWWDRIVDWIKSLLGKAGFNPFEQAAEDILSKDIGTVKDILNPGGVFYQATDAILNAKRDAAFNAFQAESRKMVRLEDATNNEKYYEYEGQKIPDSVTKKVKRESRKWGNEKTAFQSSIDEAKQQLGIHGHEDIKEIADRYIDSETGLRREFHLPQTNPSQISPSDNRIYKALEKNFEARLDTYPPGTKFLTEVMVANKDKTIGSTLDFIAFLPDKDGAKVDILDWKFRELDTNKYKDIPFWNVEDWRKQMNEYKKMARDYGIKDYQFRKMEMIPIITRYAHSRVKDTTTGQSIHTGSSVRDIIVSPINLKIGDELYTLPVPLEEQSTGIRGVDEYIKKLNAIYAKEKANKGKEETKEVRNRKLNSLLGAIRSLQVARNIVPLVNQAEQYMAANQPVMDKAEDMVEKMRNPGENPKFTGAQLEDMAADLKDLYVDISVYDDMDVYLQDLIESAEDEQSKTIFAKLLKTARDIRLFKRDLNETIRDFLREQSRGMGVNDVTAPERTIKGWTRYTRGSSESTTNALHFFYKLESPVKQRLAIESRKIADEYKKLQDRVVAYKEANGLDWKNVFDKLIVKGSNVLISRVRGEFYKELDKAAENADFKWFEENVNLNEYRKLYEEQKAKDFAFIEKQYPGETVEAINTRALEKEKFEKKWNIDNASALTNFKLKLFVKDKWISDEYKELHKKGNEVLLEIYEKANELNSQYADHGLLPRQFTRRFLPFVRKIYAEKFAFGGKISVFDSFIQSISIDTEREGQGMRDPRTGQLINKIPIAFMHDFARSATKKGEEVDYSKVSTDLVKNLMMYETQLKRYEAYSEIENRLELLSIVEKAKGSLQTTNWGEVVREFSDDPDNPGEVKTSKDNEKNFKLLEAHIKNRVYGQRYINEDSFDQKVGRVGSRVAKKVNKFLGVQVLPEDLEGRTISLTRLIQAVNKYFGMKTMGLNIPVAITVLLGGSFQNTINSGRYFTRKDLRSGFMRLATKSFTGEDGKKAAALIEYFFPMLDNETRRKQRKVSATAAQRFSLGDKMYVLMRNFSQIVETTSFLALAENTMVEDGELVNINTFVKNKYPDTYKLPQAERKEQEKKIQEEIDKLKSTRSLINGGSKIVNDELVIEGISERESEGVYKFREFVQQISKDAVGNTTEDDMNLIRMSVIGSSFMMFKNWIPRLVDVRLGELRYTPGKDAYEWGRMRMMMDVMSHGIFNCIGNIRGIITGSDKGMAFLHEMYERRIKKYARTTGLKEEDIHLTEAEFIEMVRSGLHSQVKELILLSSLVTIYLSLPTIEPDPDDPDEVKGLYQFGLKSMNKVMNEIGFFYSPSSIVSIANSSIFPSLGLLTDLEQILLHTTKEIWAIGTSNEELAEKNKVLKYIFKAAPVTKEMLQYIAIFNKDVADGLGVKIQAQPLLSPQQH